LHVKSEHVGNVLAAGEASEDSKLETDDVNASSGRQALVTKPPEGVTTTLDPTGMSMNAEGDLEAFIAAGIANAIMVVVCVGIFAYVRKDHPMIYSHNVILGIAPSTPSDEGYMGWYAAARDADFEKTADGIGLDNALMIKYCDTCLKMLVTYGFPIFFVIGPMNCAFGGFAAGKDYLSYLSMGNVEDGSWLYFVHMCVVWFVIVTIQWQLFSAQQWFMPIRFDWLRRMAEVRANTILVEGIPPEYRSDVKLKEYFEKIFPGMIKSAFIAKDTIQLCALIDKYNEAKTGLEEAQAQWESDEKAEDKRPKKMTMRGMVDTIEFFEEEMKAQEELVKAEKERVVTESNENVGVPNRASGFVTFVDRKDAEMAMRLDYTFNKNEWVCSSPPEPDDVLWDDLKRDENVQAGRNMLGYAAATGLYFAYLPCVIGITNIANMINMGPLQSVWQGLAPTMGLQIMVAFLPTLLILIFRMFFTLKADAFAQHKVQVWYFWFQVVFVILATAVGQDALGFTKTLFTDPFAIFSLLATTMPYATHFYMNFMTIQWATHAMNILRYVTLAKFQAFKKLFKDEDKAKAKAEPEDQDYYGIGSRAARWSITMAIVIVYGTLSPSINILGWITFWIMRMIYGYLIPFAETKKADLGGVFWVTMLKQLYVANFIYVILMTGVLLERSDSWIPGMVSAAGLVWVWHGMNKFESSFAWEKLPITEMLDDAPKVTQRTLDGHYKQKELDDEPVGNAEQRKGAFEG
jgi:hypothetical protein